MTPPTKKIRPLVSDLLSGDPTPNGGYTTLDLQALAAGIRAVADGDTELLAVANSLDSLSELSPADIDFLRKLPQQAQTRPDPFYDPVSADQPLPEPL